jgi:hypothetical protein
MDSIGDEALARLLRDLHGWHRHGDCIWRSYQFDDFPSAAQFVGRGRGRDRAHRASAGHRHSRRPRHPELHPTVGGRLTVDDLAVASRIQRLVGDHRHPVGRAAPWSPRGPLTGVHERPVGPAGP